MRSFAECALLFSPAWLSARPLGLPLPPSPSETRPFWLVAERIGHFAPRQQALLTRAFAPSWALRISFRAAWVWFVPAWPIPKGFAQTQKTALLAWEPPVLFH
jgi:hypothetical protein